MKLPGTFGSVIPWWIVAFLVALILAFVVGLTGCASMDYEWTRHRPPAPGPWITVKVFDADTACRAMNAKAGPDMRILGCAQWRPDGCTIYLQRGAPQWVTDHETRHCEGFTHD